MGCGSSSSIPRRTEVAAHADLHLQLVPGTDVALFAALLRTILAEGLHDAAVLRPSGSTASTRCAPRSNR